MNCNISFDVKLLSDTCCSDGMGNGSSVDVCAYFDENGLPVIPGRRFKGLLKEKAQLLAANSFSVKDSGVVTNEDVEALFGADGGVISKIQVNDAYLKKAVKITEELASKYNAKEIASVFSQERYQTAIGENGVAKDHSLRNIETVVKGTEFEGSIKINNSTTKDVEIIKAALKLLRNIGLNKSRGLGEIVCGNITAQEYEAKSINYNKTNDKVEYEYTITLLQDVSLMQNSPMNNPDYIQGSTLQGAFAKYLANITDFNEMFFNDVLFGNAYISNGNIRFIPAPISLVAVKNKDEKAFSLADGFTKDEKCQYVPVNGYTCIDGEKLSKLSVNKKTESHINKKLDLLYTTTQIAKGQVFKGSVFGSDGAISALKQVVENNNGIFTLGASGTAQYGKCKIEIAENKEENKNVEKSENLVVHLVSNAIIVDEFSNNSVLAEDLINELKKYVKFDSCDTYLKTELTGGYNAKWGMPKGQYESFSKGSTIVLKNCSFETLNETMFIGINNDEGYGQILIRPIYNVNEYIVSEEKVDNGTSVEIKSTEAKEIESKIILKRQKSEVTLAALYLAENQYKEKKEVLSNSAAMRILTLYQGLKSSEDILTTFKKTSEKSFEKNMNLLEVAKELVKEFNKLEITTEKNSMFDLYLRTFIGRYKELYQTNKRNER